MLERRWGYAHDVVVLVAEVVCDTPQILTGTSAPWGDRSAAAAAECVLRLAVAQWAKICP